MSRPHPSGNPLASRVRLHLLWTSAVFLTPWQAGEKLRNDLGGPPLFDEDFEHGLEHWRLYGRDAAEIVDSGDPAHGRVLQLVPQGDAYALIAGSERWRGVRLEGELCFRSEVESYLGVVYDFRQRGERVDCGVIYLKAPDGYLQANPQRDCNVSRTLYGEYRAPLGEAAMQRGEWPHFAAEVIGRECHVYVGRVAEPQLTFAEFELDSGALGLQPRSVGGEVWVDDLTVTAIESFSYAGPPRPEIEYDTSALLTQWQAIGPLARTDDELARTPAAPGRPWRAFATDRRGAVVTGTVVDTHGPNTVAYFRTRIPSEAACDAVLEISTVDDLAIWLNGSFQWFLPRADAAWYDFFRTPGHRGQRIPIVLGSGDNELVLRVRGGVYASGGFFARVMGGE